MPQWLRIGCVTLGLLGSAALAAPAVVVSFGTPPEVYAATYLYEEWEALDLSGLTGFLDHTEQIEGADAATSSQTAGIDAVPNPSCLPPCTGLTAGASTPTISPPSTGTPRPSPRCPSTRTSPAAPRSSRRATTCSRPSSGARSGSAA